MMIIIYLLLLQVELEATKEAYEQEINSITSFFEKEIFKLKNELERERNRRLNLLNICM